MRFDPDDHPHRRRNRLSGEWVLVSPHQNADLAVEAIRARRRTPAGGAADIMIVSAAAGAGPIGVSA